MNYLIGHNPQVISQLSRGGLNITTSEEIARGWVRYQRSITQLNHESVSPSDGAVARDYLQDSKIFLAFLLSLLQFCTISHYHSCQQTGRKGYFIYTVTVISYKCQ